MEKQNSAESVVVNGFRIDLQKTGIVLNDMHHFTFWARQRK